MGLMDVAESEREGKSCESRSELVELCRPSRLPASGGVGVDPYVGASLSMTVRDHRQRKQSKEIVDSDGGPGHVRVLPRRAGRKLPGSLYDQFAAEKR